MADQITQQTGQPVTLVSGDRGEFTVWVGDEVVAKKTLRGFPTPEQAAQAVAAKL